MNSDSSIFLCNSRWRVVDIIDYFAEWDCLHLVIDKGKLMRANKRRLYCDPQWNQTFSFGEVVYYIFVIVAIMSCWILPPMGFCNVYKKSKKRYVWSYWRSHLRKISRRAIFFFADSLLNVSPYSRLDPNLNYFNEDMSLRYFNHRLI